MSPVASGDNYVAHGLTHPRPAIQDTSPNRPDLPPKTCHTPFRHIGVSSHDREHLKTLIETYPQQIEVVLTPYTARTKVVTDEAGLWAAIQKNDVGWFGIKPFASNSIFKGDSSPDSPDAKEDNKIARLAIRCILCNPAITAPMAGMITPQQVDNVCMAVVERRQLDLKEQAQLDRAMDRAWANLSPHYQWLKNWEYV